MCKICPSTSAMPEAAHVGDVYPDGASAPEGQFAISAALELGS